MIWIIEGYEDASAWWDYFLTIKRLKKFTILWEGIVKVFCCNEKKKIYDNKTPRSHLGCFEGNEPPSQILFLLVCYFFLWGREYFFLFCFNILLFSPISLPFQRQCIIFMGGIFFLSVF